MMKGSLMSRHHEPSQSPSLSEVLAELETLLIEGQSLRPENRRLLMILKELVARPDELGAGWWDEFDKTLRETRLKVRTLHHG
jgi:hypothetical protein